MTPERVRDPMIEKERLLQEVLTRGVTDIITEDNLVSRLKEGQPLRVKYGIDPTMTSAHLGHVVPLRKLRQFQELGHTAVFIIGDYTARIGDPTGKSTTREALSEEQVQRNVKYYFDQANQILDPKKTEVHLQSEWFEKFNLEKLIRLMSQTTYAQLMAHETFAQRAREGKVLHFHEMLYPVLQAYDSVMVEADIELGGEDQRFNFVLTRDLQRDYGQVPEEVILCNYLPGIDGQEKMSKSLGNTINLSDSARKMFFAVMSISDSLMRPFFELATEISLSEIDQLFAALSTGEIHPMDLKKKLGIAIASLYHPQGEVEKAAMSFQRTVQQKEVPKDLKTFNVEETVDLINFLFNNSLVKSKSEARRLLAQKGVKANDITVEGNVINVGEEGVILRVGRKIIVSLVLA